MIKKIKIYIPTGLLFAALAFAQNAIAQGVNLPNVGLPSTDLTLVVQGLVQWLLAIFGFLAIISFLISGMMYFMATGDDKEMEKARKQMKWSIIGVVVGIMGLVMIRAIDQLLRGGGLF